MTFSGPTNFAADNGPTSIAVGDFNNDSRPDLAVTNGFPSTVSILLGNGSGGFTGPTNFPVGSAPEAVVVADFNSDSRLDLAVATFGATSVSILLGNGSGGFASPTSIPTGSNPTDIAVGAFNNDARPDLAVTNQGTDNVSILLGNGSGGFTGPTNLAAGRFPSAVAVGDVNGDSRQDLVTTASGSGDILTFLGNGNGGFAVPTSINIGGAPNTVLLANLSGDSRDDVALNGSSSVHVWRTGGGITSYPVGSSPLSIAVGDFNSDSRPDLATANLGSDNASVLLGNASGGFVGPANFGAGDEPHEVAVGDFDGDGLPDLAVANFNSDNVSILLNTTGYPRPKGASPLLVSLVPAYDECLAPNRTHASPLASPSCNPPAKSSPLLTLGTPDANGAAANSNSSVRLRTLPGITGGEDDADLGIDVKITDVRCEGISYPCGEANTAGPPDYLAFLRVRLGLRITDRYNGASEGEPGTDAGTGDTTFDVPVPCGISATPPSIGSTCELTTTADAVTGDPNTVKEGTRAVWELGQVRVYDGGPDGNIETPAGDALFMAQGVFVP